MDIEYIENDKRRSVSHSPLPLCQLIHLNCLLILVKDTFYKRRKGLIKKAYEISVMCGAKISIICTDFQKNCFTFCNSGRLEFDLKKVFGGIGSSIWLTSFDESDVSSVNPL